MNYIRPSHVGLALLAGTLAPGPVDAHDMGMPSMPPVSIPSIPIPDTSGAVRSAVDSARDAASRSGRSPSGGEMDNSADGVRAPWEGRGGGVLGAPVVPVDDPGNGGKAGSDAPPDQYANAPGDLGPDPNSLAGLIARNNAAGPEPDTPDTTDTGAVDDNSDQYAQGEGGKVDPNAPRSDANQGNGVKYPRSEADKLAWVVDKLRKGRPGWDEARINAEAQNQLDDPNSQFNKNEAKRTADYAKTDPEFQAILDSERSKPGATDESATVEAAKKWATNRNQDTQAAKQAEDARKAAQAEQDKHDKELADLNSPEHKKQVAVTWSQNYDRQDQAWLAQNTTTLPDGRKLLPNEVAALNEENAKTYKNNRSNQQIEDDTEEIDSGRRSNGTQGCPPPIKANTTNTPRPTKPDGYLPPDQR
jgi:hypothetical protein